MKMWDKGIEVNRLIEEFTSGRDREVDLKLAGYDILGSLAHVKMLAGIGLLNEHELSSLVNELKNIYYKVQKGEFVIEKDVEDVHSQLEIMLTRALGETGKKVHTARSRNDQVLLDLKLYSRDRIKEIVLETGKLFDTLISLSNRYKDVLMPGYTHMQIAMPSSFGLWFGAYAECLAEDMILLESAYKITDQNPLGSAAGFGSSFPVDRDLTTRLLGFGNMHVNAVNAQMNRGKMEKIVAFALGSVGSTLSRLATDICTWSGQNFGFFTLPDEFTTGSSIMPHKKNPDAVELIRAKGNKLQSLTSEIALIGSNLPSGYHRDFQLIKESYFPAFDILFEIIPVTKLVIANLRVNPGIINDELYRNLFSVEEVNRLVMQGYAFRDAYKAVAGKIADGSFTPGKLSVHTHEGSMGNLCNHLIEKKMDDIMNKFDFSKVEKAFESLLE